MEKPITLRYNYLIKTMTDAINESGLPSFVVLYVLRDMIAVVNRQAVQQGRDELAAYQESQAKESEVCDADMG